MRQVTSWLSYVTQFQSVSKGGIKMKKYRVREGSIADYARILGTGALFWGILFAFAAQVYPM